MQPNIGYKQKIATHFTKKGLSSQTARAYITAINRFIDHFSYSDIKTLTEDDLIAYISSINKTGLFRHTISSLKIVYNEIIPKEYNLKSIKFYKSINNKNVYFLTQEEIQSMFNVTSSSKTKLILSMIYSSMIPINQILSIKLEDIDYESLTIKINTPNSTKRHIIFQPILRPILSIYLEEYKPESYLFYGRSKDKKLSRESINKSISSIAMKARIKGKVSSLVIRKSAILQMIKNGIDTNVISHMLGYSNKLSIRAYKDMVCVDYKSVYNPLSDIFFI